MNIIALEPDDIAKASEALRPFIEPALEYEHSGMSFEYVIDKLEAGEWSCLLAVDEEGVKGCQTIQAWRETLPDGREEFILNLVTTAGHKIDDWVEPMLEALKTLARKAGAQGIQTRGRLGWLKKLKRYGFKPMYFIARWECDQ